MGMLATNKDWKPDDVDREVLSELVASIKRRGKYGLFIRWFMPFSYVTFKEPNRLRRSNVDMPIGETAIISGTFVWEHKSQLLKSLVGRLMVANAHLNHRPYGERIPGSKSEELDTKEVLKWYTEDYIKRTGTRVYSNGMAVAARTGMWYAIIANYTLSAALCMVFGIFGIAMSLFYNCLMLAVLLILTKSSTRV